MALYKTRQLLANYSQQSVRDISVSRLEELYAPIVAQRKAMDEANEREFNLNLPHLERVKKILAQQLEEIANEENAHLPVVSYFDAIQVAKSARVSENDIGCRALITMLENTWKKDRTASISAAKYTALVDHFKKNYPRSAVVDVLEEVGRKGYLSLEVSKLAEIASEIQSQEDYERVILENGLQSNAPHCKKARQFILALVNGDDEDITENEQYNRHFRPYEKPDRDAPPYAEDEEVPHDVKRFDNLYKELREKKQRGDKIGNTRPFERTGQSFGAKRISFGFFLSLGDGQWEDNAMEDGWDVNDPAESDAITDAARTVEDNVVNWLNKNVGNTRSEGHNSYDELAGSIFVEKGSEGHTFIKEAIEDGEPMSVGKGNFPLDPFEGVDDKYARVFNPSLDFMGDSVEEGDEEVDTKDYSPTASKKAQDDEDMEEEPFDGSEEEFNEPEEGDYVIQNNGVWVVGERRQVADSSVEWDDQYRMIAEDMEKRQFWPNVWNVSDHGNAYLVEDFAKEVENLPPKQENPEDDFDDESEESDEEDFV